ncbi:MAG: hypothetical protein J7639_25690 [Paenibacillaceae bacterium]|nr:hypothetical protein [Paenibacillaceae bacterium]
MQDRTALLGRWLHSWIRPDGSINGFNNHSVWGGNPYRWIDFHAGHSTWSSPLLPALAGALNAVPDKSAAELLDRMCAFQASSLQESGQYRFIGFESGETSRNALIHNAITNVALVMAVRDGRQWLSEQTVERIRTVFLSNLQACLHFSGGRAGETTTCNQEYARIWSKLLYREAYGDTSRDDELVEDLDYMIAHFHTRGTPDGESGGTLRYLGDAEALEPAEYYGLMIAPLALAARIFGNRRYQGEAKAIALHVARSAWTDEAGQKRFHRLWYRRDNRWFLMKEPMLVAGMGLTLYGIHQYLQLERDAELEQFLADCDRTYAHYQTAGGYFVSASGWNHEANVAPSTSWHTHDLLYCSTGTERRRISGTSGASPSPERCCSAMTRSGSKTASTGRSATTTGKIFTACWAKRRRRYFIATSRPGPCRTKCRRRISPFPTNPCF